MLENQCTLVLDLNKFSLLRLQKMVLYNCGIETKKHYRHTDRMLKNVHCVFHNHKMFKAKLM